MDTLQLLVHEIVARVFVLAALVGVAAGYLARGRLLNLARLRFRALWLIWLVALVQAIVLLTPLRRVVSTAPGHTWLLPVYLGVGLWLALNLLRTTSRDLRVVFALCLLGGALNAAAVVANGRMPYSERASRIAGLPQAHPTSHQGHHGDDRLQRSIAAYADYESAFGEPATSQTRLVALTDVIPLPPPVMTVVSIGDVAILTGIAVGIAVGMRRRDEEPTPDRSPQPQPPRRGERGRPPTVMTSDQ